MAKIWHSKRYPSSLSREDWTLWNRSQVADRWAYKTAGNTDIQRLVLLWLWDTAYRFRKLLQLKYRNEYKKEWYAINSNERIKIEEKNYKYEDLEMFNI